MLRAALHWLLTRTPAYPHWLWDRTERRLDRELVSLARGDVFDIGCGRRKHEGMFRQRSEVHRYVALDYLPWDDVFQRSTGETESALGATGELLNPSFALRPHVWGDGQALPFRDGSADTVALFGVFEHVADPGALAREACRVLRPGGAALIRYPFLYELHGGINGDADYYRYTKAEITRLLAGAGFSEIDVVQRGNVGTAVATLVTGFTVQLLYRLLGRSRLYMVLLPPSAVWFAAVQFAGLLFDRLDRTGLFPASYKVAARRPAE